jgi:hypothetical protein
MCHDICLVLIYFFLELRCVHSYYHLGPALPVYFSVGDSPGFGLRLLPLGLVGSSRDQLGDLLLKLRERSWFYLRTRCVGAIPTLKVCVIARNVVVAAGGDSTCRSL